VCFHAHPDHVKVHLVGVRAAELAGVTHVYEATVNRDHMVRLMASNPQWAAEAAPPDVAEFGLPESEITTVVDVRAAMGAKREAMAAHESQVGDFGPFLAMPTEQVEAAFGQESFRRRGGATGQQGHGSLGDRATALDPHGRHAGQPRLQTRLAVVVVTTPWTAETGR